MYSLGEKLITSEYSVLKVHISYCENFCTVLRTWKNKVSHHLEIRCLVILIRTHCREELRIQKVMDLYEWNSSTFVFGAQVNAHNTINDDISLNFNNIISSAWPHCLPAQLFWMLCEWGNTKIESYIIWVKFILKVVCVLMRFLLPVNISYIFLQKQCNSRLFCRCMCIGKQRCCLW